MKKTLQFFVFQYPQGPSFHQLMIGDRIVARSDNFPDEAPSAMIDVFYEDYTAYSHVDLLAAIERATTSGADILFAKMYYPKTQSRDPIGRVTLFPSSKWRSKELAIFDFLRPIIESAIEREKA